MGLSCKVESLYDLNEIIIQGLPKNCLERTVSHLSSNVNIKKDLQDRIVSPSTYKRRKNTLKTHEGERVERLASIYASALELWGNQEDVQNFLFSTNPILNKMKPIDLVFTALGARLVEQLMDEIRYGLPV